MANRVEDIWVAVYGAAFANQVETAYLSYQQTSNKTRVEVADLHRKTFADQAQEIAASAVQGLVELQKGEEGEEGEEDST